MSAKIDATTNLWPGLFVGCCANLELLGVVKEDGSYVNDAVVTCEAIDPGGNVVGTVALVYLGKRITLGFETYADGNYRGLLPAATQLVAGTVYQLRFQCDNPGFSFTSYKTAQPRTA